LLGDGKQIEINKKKTDILKSDFHCDLREMLDGLLGGKGMVLIGHVPGKSGSLVQGLPTIKDSKNYTYYIVSSFLLSCLLLLLVLKLSKNI